MAGGLLDYLLAELLELLGKATREGSCLRGPIADLHEQLLAVDEELRRWWLNFGMPADCPPELVRPQQSAL